MTSSRNFRLPPLEGDNLVVKMEREMLQRWGFLDGKVRTQTTTAPPPDQEPNPDVITLPNNGVNEREGQVQTEMATGSGNDQGAHEVTKVERKQEEEDEASIISDSVSVPIDGTRHNDSRQDKPCVDISDTDTMPGPKIDSGDVPDSITKAKTENLSVNGESSYSYLNASNLKCETHGTEISRILDRNTISTTGEQSTIHSGNTLDVTNTEKVSTSIDVSRISAESSTISKTDTGHIISESESPAKSTHTSNNFPDVSESNTNSTNDNTILSYSDAIGLRIENRTSSGNDTAESSSIREAEDHPGKVNDDDIKGGNIAQKKEDKDIEKGPNKEDVTTTSMSEAARRLYDVAHKAYGRKEFCECLLFVDEALEMDEAKGGDPDLWLMRAKVMNSMEDHREALRSVYKVKAVERSSSLWVEGALALEKLGLLATAENWVARAMQTCQGQVCDARLDDRRDVMDILLMMRSRLRVQRVFGPLVKDKPIHVSASFKHNRAVKAIRKIKRSEVIFRELPEILEQSIKSHRYTACAECAKALVQPSDLVAKGKGSSPDLKKAMKKLWPKVAVVDCQSCAEVKYCSDQCRDAHWWSCHRVVCPSNPESTASMLYDVRRSFRDVIAADGSSWQGWWNAEVSPTFLSRVWASFVCRAKRLADLNDKESYLDADWSMVESFMEKYFSSTKFQAESEAIPKMHELIESIFKRSRLMRFPITEKEFNKRYSQLAHNAVAFRDPVNPAMTFVEAVRKDKKLAKKLQSQVDLTLVPTPEFHGLFPLVCCLNHSCVPNAEARSERVEGRPGVSVRALMDIKDGEEITVCYVDPGLERHERRSQLWRKYKFVCQCLKCIHEGRGSDLCTNCGKSPSKIQSESESRSSDVIQSNSEKARVEGLDGGNDDDGSRVNEPQSGDNSTNATSTTTLNKDADEQKEKCSFNETTDVPLELQGVPGIEVTGAKSAVDSDKPSVDVGSVLAVQKGADEGEGEQNQRVTKDGQYSLEPKLKFSVCGRCKKAWYCSAQCQKESWVSGHKKICVPPR